MYGDQARHWLAELPAIVAAYAENWELVVEAPLEGGSVSAVIGVEQNGNPEALKIHPPWSKPSELLGKSSAETEAGAFEIWDGTCAPKLRAHDSQALLLERIMPAGRLTEIKARDIANLVLRTSQPHGVDIAKFFKYGIPPVDEEVWKRYHRARAQRHPKISELLLMRAAIMGCYISAHNGRVNPRCSWEMIHGDLKPKNVLKRPDGSFAVIDPSPAFGGGLYDVALWAIDTPEGIEERCEEVSDCLETDLQTLGRMAIALAIPEICLASPARAEATLEAVHEITGATDLEEFFGPSYVEAEFMDERYTVIRTTPRKKPSPS